MQNQLDQKKDNILTSLQYHYILDLLPITLKNSGWINTIHFQIAINKDFWIFSKFRKIIHLGGGGGGGTYSMKSL